jgi:DNA polymerase-3 subunit gamma/tau
VAIAEGRHIDVVEMDAASHTGVDDVREIIEAVRYASVSARFKIYIIDEVHMLSKNAFNALLKTLEEPPEHVKFLFATTEVDKVPVTVLSRCQRFDLRRIPSDKLAEHFARVAEAEQVEVEPEALNVIARAAEGSARDGLSLLDQAIAHGEGHVTAGRPVTACPCSTRPSPMAKGMSQPQKYVICLAWPIGAGSAAFWKQSWPGTRRGCWRSSTRRTRSASTPLR